jgi:predicted DNA-binding transcriptional regulator AlpA
MECETPAPPVDKQKARKLDKAEVLAGFERLPNVARVKLPVVCALFDCHPATVWRRVEKGTLPAPQKIGGNALWSVGKLRAVQS